ncbi:hypothetical protein HPB50_021845 [Hyalomma asiaticum]|uniref:Uncharacterized protein n=1 Tax=Hyalomma asiaticum TaxID=266040 RepID=A0ACB7TLT0_HYAAI|nr:hypothetical protein HPB50_021845 [Hyalomma asiaticum]
MATTQKPPSSSNITSLDRAVLSSEVTNILQKGQKFCYQLSTCPQQLLAMVKKVDLRQLMVTCCSPLVEQASRTVTKRSCSFGVSLRSSTAVMSSAEAGANRLGAQSLRRNQRLHASSTAMVPLRTLGHPGHNVNSGAGAGRASTHIPIYT